MRKSCFMKLKLTLEESTQPNDTEIIMDGMQFIIDKGQCHYFSNKQLDFILDRTGLINMRLFNRTKQVLLF